VARAALPGGAGPIPRAGAATIGLLGFTWIELVSGWGEKPATLVTAALAYTAYTLGAQFLFGTELWSRRGETFAVYFDLLSRLSSWERREGVMGVRPPLAGLPRLDTPPGTVFFVCAMIGTITFDGFSQGQLWRDLSVDLAGALDGLVGREAAAKVVATLGLALGVAFVTGFYRLGIDGALRRRAARGPARCGARSSTRRCRSPWSTWPPTI